jgi:transporter family-2 protein
LQVFERSWRDFRSWIMAALPVPFILVAGAMQAFGAVMSARLRVSLANPWLASTIAFMLNVFFFASLFAVLPRPLPTVEGVAAMPWWAPLAGLTGAVAVIAGLLFVDKIGAGPFNGLVITANILASIAIDHFGLMNVPVHSLNARRVAGAALMICVVALISRFWGTDP